MVSHSSARSGKKQFAAGSVLNMLRYCLQKPSARPIACRLPRCTNIGTGPTAACLALAAGLAEASLAVEIVVECDQREGNRLNFVTGRTTGAARGRQKYYGIEKFGMPDTGQKNSLFGRLDLSLASC